MSDACHLAARLSNCDVSQVPDAARRDGKGRRTAGVRSFLLGGLPKLGYLTKTHKQHLLPLRTFQSRTGLRRGRTGSPAAGVRGPRPEAPAAACPSAHRSREHADAAPAGGRQAAGGVRPRHQLRDDDQEALRGAPRDIPQVPGDTAHVPEGAAGDQGGPRRGLDPLRRPRRPAQGVHVLPPRRGPGPGQGAARRGGQEGRGTVRREGEEQEAARGEQAAAGQGGGVRPAPHAVVVRPSPAPAARPLAGHALRQGTGGAHQPPGTAATDAKQGRRPGPAPRARRPARAALRRDQGPQRRPRAGDRLGRQARRRLVRSPPSPPQERADPRPARPAPRPP